MKKKIIVIDGIEFDSPKYFEEYLVVGFCGILLILASPIWIWFYLFGRIFKKMGKEKEVEIEKEESESYY